MAYLLYLLVLVEFEDSDKRVANDYHKEEKQHNQHWNETTLITKDRFHLISIIIQT